MSFSRPPSIDALVRSIRSDPDIAGRFPDSLITESARTAVKHLRGTAHDGAEFEAWAKEHLLELIAHRIRPAINATGVILHTGLGRARLAPTAQLAVSGIAFGHGTVELDIEGGGRGDRQNAVRDHLQHLTGGEDGLVVNNCAGAVFLCLAALCHGREVLLSRGEMVEIGGSYRMPEIVEASGADLIEVGCTNKTHLGDYSSKISEATAAIVRCHRSNFSISGFTDAPSARELSQLALESGVLFLDDLGSGCLVDTTRFSLPKERTVRNAVAEGADLVMFSGDKLLGGPQAGIIVGKSALIKRLKSHPLARALRPDKLTLAGLEATLLLYRLQRELEIPVWRYASRTLSQIDSMARRIADVVPGESVLEAGASVLGGGSMPDAKLPTMKVGISSGKLSAAGIAHSLRMQSIPIVTTVSGDRCWIDPRTIEEDEMEVIAQSLIAIMAS